MSNINTEDGLREFIERVAEMHREDVRLNQLRPKVLWFNEESNLRLIAEPNTNRTGDLRQRLAWALAVLTAVQHEDTTIVQVIDSYGAKAMTRHNGEPWGPGGMEEAVMMQTEDMDLVTEMITVISAQNGWVASASVPYERTAEGVDFKWDDIVLLRESPDEPGRMSAGDMTGMLREATVVPRISEKMPDEIRETLGLSEERANMHMLCAAVKHVGGQVQLACAIPVHSEVEAEVLEESFRDVPHEMHTFGEDDDAEVDVTAGGQ